MIERVRFWRAYVEGTFRFGELCDLHGISRKTGYKLLRRIAEEGIEEGVRDRSRAPKTCPHRMDEALADALVELRREHPSWGPKKIVGVLERRLPQYEWPAASSVGDLLKRRGMVQPRRRRPQPGHPGRGATPMSEPNAVWTADFKGHARTRDSIYCYPITVQDGHSRYLLACTGLLSTKHEGVEPVFDALFREYGLPEVIRTDNGTPFATQAMRRLSRLSVKFIKLGIRPELNEPSHPEQNGRHERMHRTLKAETMRPPAANLRAQQRLFDRFRAEYNDERPHEALGQRTPVEVYRRSPRPMPEKIAPIEYPSHFEVRLVSRNGGVRWDHGWVNVSHVLAEERVGFEEVDDGIWSVHFGPVLLGRFHERDLRIYGSAPHNRSRRRELSTAEALHRSLDP
jgi:transposase InsO family protein